MVDIICEIGIKTESHIVISIVIAVLSVLFRTLTGQTKKVGVNPKEKRTLPNTKGNLEGAPRLV